jgi:hypothetical protein
MNLPFSDDIPVQCLASCFRHKSTPYKFYWLISILQNVEQGNVIIPKKELFAAMIANAWYTVNYFKISFGKQDKMQDAIQEIMKIEEIAMQEDKGKVLNKILSSNNPQTLTLLKHFDKNVPHWFLSSWFSGSNKNEIYNLSRDFDSGTIYALFSDRIEINPSWVSYLKNFAGIIKDYCYWNLALYLQTHNANVPDIPNKLIKPPIRGSLDGHRKNFWNLYLEEVSQMKCIYTQMPLTVENYAVEHFIPHSFVSHNLNWNLIPASPSFNSTKNNRLPKLNIYFESFFKIQCEALNLIIEKQPRNKYIKDYVALLW